MTASTLHGRHSAMWIDVLPHLDPRFGGIATSVPRSSVEAAALGSHRNGLIAFCEPGEQPPVDGTAVPVFPLARRAWLLQQGLRRRLETTLSGGDAFHIHGLWQVHSSMTAAYAQRANKPFVMSAHGMLDAWAFNHKGLKKRVYTKWIEAPNLRRASCLRALTTTERDDYRRLGLKGPVAVIPNGVDIPEGTSEAFLSRYPALRGKRIVLYLGRIHRKKGIDLLCGAWPVVQKQHPDAHLVIAGPDDGGTASDVARRIADAGLEGSVSMPGLLAGPLVWSALRAATVFVLPSHSEGFSRALLEAMGARRPVIATHACNFPEIAASHAGAVIAPEEQALRIALQQMLEASAGELALMGQNGERLVRERYSWDVVGRQLAALYRWVLGGGAPPSELLWERA